MTTGQLVRLIYYDYRLGSNSFNVHFHVNFSVINSH